MQPSSAARNHAMTKTEWPFGGFRVSRLLSRHKLQRKWGCDRKDRATVTSAERMGKAIRLPGIEEQDVVRVSDHRIAAIRTAKNPISNEYDAMGGIRFLRSFPFNRGDTAKIHNVNTGGLEQGMAFMLLLDTRNCRLPAHSWSFLHI